MYKNILVATDGSKLPAKAVKHAIELGKALQSGLPRSTSRRTIQRPRVRRLG
jgi:nucleotide-binding universal stress UspA family protein